MEVENEQQEIVLEPPEEPWLCRALGWLFSKVPEEGILHECIAIPCILLFSIFHYACCLLCIMGVVDYEYYHGWRIKRWTIPVDPEQLQAIKLQVGEAELRCWVR